MEMYMRNLLLKFLHIINAFFLEEGAYAPFGFPQKKFTTRPTRLALKRLK
jgi:hypothetical protein